MLILYLYLYFYLYLAMISSVCSFSPPGRAEHWAGGDHSPRQADHVDQGLTPPGGQSDDGGDRHPFQAGQVDQDLVPFFKKLSILNFYSISDTKDMLSSFPVCVFMEMKLECVCRNQEEGTFTAK